MEAETKVQVKSDVTPAYVPTQSERVATMRVLGDFLKARINSDKSYNQFNGRTLYEFIDDGTKRWNGYISPPSPLLDSDQSRIFLNFTRNQIISYLAKVAMSQVDSKIKAVNKKTGMVDQRFADVLKDLNRFSLDAENGDARYLEAALEVATKGTVIVYEGYRRETQEVKVPMDFDAETGQIKTKTETRVLFDNCYQQVVPLEDFYIANPYEPDLQKQPFVLWRKITTYLEAEREFGGYHNWKYVKSGPYTVSGDPTTFYRNKVYTDLSQDQCEVLKYWCRKKNQYIVVVSGVIVYNGVIPFKDGKYPFAKGIFEPFENFFFWGSHFPNKIMGEQDEMNTYINMMNDKTYGSLLPYGLSSDLDDLIEDDVLQVNKIRKVGDINKWKFDTLPGVSSGEMSMFQLIMNLARENSGEMSGAGSASTPRGGKLPVRQVLLKQQESMQKLSFNMNFMEDFERDRTELRIGHIMQFYSIPRIEKITGKTGKEIDEMVYRDVRLDNVKLSDGKTGTKIIKLIDDTTAGNPLKKSQLQEEMSVTEAMGEEIGQPTEVLAISVDSFSDWNLEIQIVKNSSFEKNEVLDQAVRHEYANWRFGVMQYGVPVDPQELVDWVDEAYDIDSERFKPKPQIATPGGAPTQISANNGQPGNPGGNPPAPAEAVAPGGSPGQKQAGPAKAMAPAKMPAFGDMM